MSAPPDQLVRDIVAAADSTRRGRHSDIFVARFAPYAAAAALVLAGLGRWFGWPSSVTVVSLVVLAAALGVIGYVLRRPRPSTDAIALGVDRDAALGGELHSAHWFGSSSSREEPWTAFHLARAADHANDVSWADLYPKVNASKSWLATGAVVVATLLLAFVVPARQASVAAVGQTDARPNGAPLTMVPPELQKQIDAMLAAMKDGLLSEADLRAALAKLDKDAMALDPAMQKKLAEMLKNRKIGDEARKALGAEGEEPEEVANFGLPEDVKWALEDMAKRLANSPADRQTNSENQAASAKTGEKGAGSEQAQASETSNAQMTMQMVREAASDQGQSQMMMGGGGGMGGDPKAGAGGNSAQDAKAMAQALLIAQALKKETVEANTDALGANVPKDDIRRKTEAGRSGISYAKVAPTTTFDTTRAVAPPAVPESRRPLVQSYFIRR
jgi:hypothetical protein